MSQRKQGGQQNNKNALKHGYYSGIFKEKSDVADYCSAADIEGIDEEIALIRHVIKTAALSNDEKMLSILVRATNSLNRLVRTRKKLFGGNDDIRAGLRKIAEEVLESYGMKLQPAGVGSYHPTHAETNHKPDKADLP